MATFIKVKEWKYYDMMDKVLDYGSLYENFYMKRNDNFIAIEDGFVTILSSWEILKETAKAIQVRFSDVWTEWLPKSAVDFVESEEHTEVEETTEETIEAEETTEVEETTEIEIVEVEESRIRIDENGDGVIDNYKWEIRKQNERVVRFWKVYGRFGHRQRESFCDDMEFETWQPHAAMIKIYNQDSTFTNDYSIIEINAENADECARHLDGQLYDGVFENCNFGVVKEITEKQNFRKIER